MERKSVAAGKLAPPSAADRQPCQVEMKIVEKKRAQASSGF